MRELGFDNMIITVSEDATCKVWDLKTSIPQSSSSDQNMSLVYNRSRETLKGHMGRNIRALACHNGMVATGGDDGAIKIWNVEEIVK